MTLELNAKALEVIGKVKKLLAIANDARGNEHQAAAAAAKAQELLEAYNLDMAVVGQTKKDGQRADTKRKGGLYKWQRSLWESVASLNFCMYWSIEGTIKGSKYEHRLLGREENIIGAEILADYLQQTINRLAKEKAKERDINVFCRVMIAYREGMAERLCERLSSLRKERLAAEQEQQAKDEAQRDRENGDANTTNALVLATLIADENSLNLDFRYGYEPGTTAQRRREADADWEAQMAEREVRVTERKQWELDNPEEHAAQMAADQKRQDKAWKREERNRKRRKGHTRYREQTAAEKRRNLREFDEGREVGDNISLNQQISEGTGTPQVGE